MAVSIETPNFKMLHQYMYRFGSGALCKSAIPKTVVVVMAVAEKTWSASYSAKDRHKHTPTHVCIY